MQSLFFRDLLEPRDLGDENAVRIFERFGELLLKNRASCRVRARLENRPDAMARVTVTQRGQRLRNRGGMMSEVVDHFYSAGFPTHFLPPRGAGKSFQRIVDLCLRQIVKSCGGPPP